MDLIKLPQEWLQSALSSTWFTIGTTPINLNRVLGLALILMLVWWVAKAIERLFIRFAKASGGVTLSDSAIYAFSRISRYLIWFIGSILGLNFIGFDMGSLVLMGGALGVGIGLSLIHI